MRLPLVVLLGVAVLGPAPAQAVVVADRGPAVGTVSARVPEVATRAEDGLPRHLGPGRHEVSVPVWAAPGGPGGTARLQVRGARSARCREVQLQPGRVVWAPCSFVTDGGPVTVLLRARGTVLARWSHPA